MAKRSVNDAQKLKDVKIMPKNQAQRDYMEAIINNDQTFAIGPAGSGKTFIPVMLALEMYLKGEIDKIIVTRPAVEVEESHGYLPGDLTKKLAPWVYPITEIIEDYLGKQRFIDMVKNGDFEVAPFAYMRGRTFRKAFVLLDEAQNTTPKQMEMFLTRIGEDCKVIISGDIRQSDIAKGNSGLKIALQLIERHKIPAAIIEFSHRDIVRSGLCQKWAEAFSSVLLDKPQGQYNHR